MPTARPDADQSSRDYRLWMVVFLSPFTIPIAGLLGVILGGTLVALTSNYTMADAFRTSIGFLSRSILITVPIGLLHWISLGMRREWIGAFAVSSIMFCLGTVAVLGWAVYSNMT